MLFCGLCIQTKKTGIHKLNTGNTQTKQGAAAPCLKLYQAVLEGIFIIQRSTQLPSGHTVSGLLQVVSVLVGGLSLRGSAASLITFFAHCKRFATYPSAGNEW